ncbi:hypothetical protein [Pseudolysinimonas kribbensis]|nr:hypothetical protein [Pseudolysinimonas kribbensis]
MHIENVFPSRPPYREPGFGGMRAVTGQPPSPHDRETTEDDDRALAADRALTRQSLAQTRSRIDAALGIRCDEHDAELGAWCIGSGDSGVGAVCLHRYELGLGDAARVRLPSGPAPAPFVDALAERAAAVRNVGLHAAQQEHEQRRQQQRARYNR